MTSQTRDEHRDRNDYECLDPALGQQLWRRADPECPAELYARLEAHLTFCAYCRLQAGVEKQVAAGLRDGSLRLRVGSERGGRFVRWAATAGAAALAAGLALMLMLPPRAPHEDLVLRGDDAPGIERPVAEEVVLGGRPTVRWTPLAGATRYEVEISMAGGAHEWSTTTEDAEITVPEGMGLPVGERYRVSVEPVPGYLAPDGGLRSSFRTGGVGEWLGYRLARGTTAGKFAATGGATALLLAGIVAIWHRRRI